MPWAANSASDSSMAVVRLKRSPASAMASTPKAARRSANGSEEPVGAWSTANRPQMVSSLSAQATAMPTAVVGSSSPEKHGR